MAEPISPDHHFVSQALLRRFANKAGVLQVYNVQTGVWNDLPPKQVFCYPGYNQLSAFGNVDNSLELAFSKAETYLPKILAALDIAAQNETTQLSLDIYTNLCWYCALLWHISLAGKAKAVVDFLITINETTTRCIGLGRR